MPEVATQPATAVRERTFGEAIREALAEEMRRDPRVCLLNEDVAEGAFYELDGPVRRIGAMHVPIPFSPPLEDATVPTEQQVFELARTMCNR